MRFALAEAEARAGRVTAIFAWQLPFPSIPGHSTGRRRKAGMAFLIDRVRDDRGSGPAADGRYPTPANTEWLARGSGCGGGGSRQLGVSRAIALNSAL